MERDFLVCEVGGHRKDTEEGQRPVQAKAPVQKRGAVTRVELAETQGCVLELHWIEEENSEEIEALSFIPGAVTEPRWASHMCDNKCSTNLRPS